MKVAFKLKPEAINFTIHMMNLKEVIIEEGVTYYLYAPGGDEFRIVSAQEIETLKDEGEEIIVFD